MELTIYYECNKCHREVPYVKSFRFCPYCGTPFKEAKIANEEEKEVFDAGFRAGLKEAK